MNPLLSMHLQCCAGTFVTAVSLVRQAVAQEARDANHSEQDTFGILAIADLLYRTSAAESVVSLAAETASREGRL